MTTKEGMDWKDELVIVKVLLDKAIGDGEGDELEGGAEGKGEWEAIAPWRREEREGVVDGEVVGVGGGRGGGRDDLEEVGGVGAGEEGGEEARIV